MGNLQSTHHDKQFGFVAGPVLAVLHVFTFTISPFNSRARQILLIHR